MFRVPLGRRVLRWLLRTIFRGVFHLLFDIKKEGFENIPTDQAYVIAYNHVSLFEPPLILTFWPVPPEALAGADVFDRPGQNILVKLYKAIPVRRGEYDRYALETMMAILNSGLPLAISPEGGRSHELGMRPAFPGVAHVIDKAHSLVLPLAIEGTEDHSFEKAIRGQRPTLTMRVGKPFFLPPIEGQGIQRRAARQANADQIMIKIAQLLPEKYHGVYTGKVYKQT